MKKKKTPITWFLDILELYIPIVLFIMLFLSFTIGVVFRYILKNPQTWTFELTSICFMGMCMLSCCIAHRHEDHVVFDLVYTRLSPRAQCILRILSNVLIAVFAAALMPAAIKYLVDMKGLSTQIIKIPRFLVFVSIPVMVLSALGRCLHRTVLDVRSLRNGSYAPVYCEKDEVNE